MSDEVKNNSISMDKELGLAGINLEDINNYWREEFFPSKKLWRHE